MNKTFNGNNLIFAVQWLSNLKLEAEKEYTVEVKPHRKKRSLSANDYLWVLCGKLAKEMGVDNTQVYQQHIKNMGVYRDVTINEDAAETLMASWGMHGTGWLSERVDTLDGGLCVIRLYYGSSSYNSKQMARLIDGVVQDCKALDIETLTPAELAGMMGRWGK